MEKKGGGKEEKQKRNEGGVSFVWEGATAYLVWLLGEGRQACLLSRVFTEPRIALTTYQPFLRLPVCASTGLIPPEEALQSTTLEATTIKHADVFLLTQLLQRKYC